MHIHVRKVGRPPRIRVKHEHEGDPRCKQCEVREEHRARDGVSPQHDAEEVQQHAIDHLHDASDALPLLDAKQRSERAIKRLLLRRGNPLSQRRLLIVVVAVAVVIQVVVRVVVRAATPAAPAALVNPPRPDLRELLLQRVVRRIDAKRERRALRLQRSHQGAEQKRE